jgi:hypothetical protein
MVSMENGQLARKIRKEEPVLTSFQMRELAKLSVRQLKKIRELLLVGIQDMNEAEVIDRRRAIAEIIWERGHPNRNPEGKSNVSHLVDRMESEQHEEFESESEKTLSGEPAGKKKDVESVTPEPYEIDSKPSHLRVVPPL